MVSKFVLKIWGWKVVGSFPIELKKCVIIMAPHTSFWDFVLGRLYLNTLPYRAYFLIKKEFFLPVFGAYLKYLGALPVDRGSKKNNMVDQMADKFNSSQNLLIVITPEGTRKKVKKWKRGFYDIAVKAKVPILVGALDYKKREIHVEPIFYPTGNYAEDMKFIKKRYIGITAKFPENFTIGDI